METTLEIPINNMDYDRYRDQTYWNKYDDQCDEISLGIFYTDRIVIHDT